MPRAPTSDWVRLARLLRPTWTSQDWTPGGCVRIRLEVACDVDNPLTGQHGAAAVYGPQKGANVADVRTLDAALGHWADLVASTIGADLRGAPGSGAAGGVGFAAAALLGGKLRHGIEVVLELTGFADALNAADLVVTGEGSLDEHAARQSPGRGRRSGPRRWRPGCRGRRTLQPC